MRSQFLSAALFLSAAAAAVAPQLVQAQPRGGPPPQAREIVRCESDNNRLRECHIPGSARIELTRQLSSAACVEGRTWGVRKDRLWVDKGCRAEFAAFGGAWGGGGWKNSIICASDDNRRATCSWDARRGRPRMLEQISNTTCKEGRNWGQTRNGDIWVDNGCRARFGAR
jgi:hypothetical protein